VFSQGVQAVDSEPRAGVVQYLILFEVVVGEVIQLIVAVVEVFELTATASTEGHISQDIDKSVELISARFKSQSVIVAVLLADKLNLAADVQLAEVVGADNVILSKLEGLEYTNADQSDQLAVDNGSEPFLENLKFQSTAQATVTFSENVISITVAFCKLPLDIALVTDADNGIGAALSVIGIVEADV